MKNFYYTFLFLAFSLCITAQTTPTGGSTEVGVTEGQLSVSLTGSATYSIPIAVPPGINGVVPQISLAYNSQGGNGIAGYGWNISGVSAITRIPSTKFHDGLVGGVNLDSNDRFSFDGQRLILKSGTYGYAGAVYETENFSNIKIATYGITQNPTRFYFIVYYPDGSKATYDAEGGGSSLNYSIKSWTNAQGVTITYSYIYDGNNSYIDYIKYGHITAGNPINTIKFNYTDRNRPEQSYVHGISFNLSKKLSSINVTGNGGDGFRNYILDYNSTSLGYQRLEKITESSGDGKSYNPTVFTYETTKESLEYVDSNTTLSVGNISAKIAGTVSGDFEGDENMDFLLYPTAGPDSKSKYWLYTNISSGNYGNMGIEHNVGTFESIFTVNFLTWNNKLYAKQGWAVAKKTDTNYTFSVYCAGASSPISPQYERVVNFPTQAVTIDCSSQCKPVDVDKIFPKKILSGDFNGDGLTDVIAIDTELEYNICSNPFNNGCNKVPMKAAISKKVYFVDLKRDNTTNFLTYSGELASVITSSSKVEVADVNGDGKSDFMVFENGKVATYTLDSANQLVLLWDYSDSNISIDPNIRILLGDYNGDGKTDFIIPKTYGSIEWYKYTSTGIGFIKKVENFIGIPYEQNTSLISHDYLASDYNKDGKTDLIETITTKNSENENGLIQVVCYYNLNGSFWSGPRIQGISSYNTSINLNPIPVYLSTGRGMSISGKPYNPKLEIAYLSNNKVFYFNSSKDSSKDKLLRTITTGNGVSESITYQSLSRNSLDDKGNSIYAAGYSENYPQTDIESAVTVQVVTKLEKQNGIVSQKQLFAYAGATSNLEGLGFMGFRASMRTNWFEKDSQIISTISKFDPKLRGANVENYSYLGLTYPAIALNNAAPNTPRTSKIIVNNTRTATETLLATNSITFLPGAIITPTAGNTFIAKVTPDYDANGFAETNTSPPYGLISKSLSFYESNLSPTKVFKLQNVQSNNYNILENTSSETNIIYDGNNNPTESISKIRSGGAGQQTTTSTVAYEATIQTPYMVGRPQSKTQTVSTSGDSMTSQEIYEYGLGTESNLLKTIQKYGNNTSAITETNGYDAFGNITTKTISASGVTDRKTGFKYDPTGRFLKESTDIEGFITVFEYYPNGTLKSESKQTELNTWSNALVTGYEYDSWFRKKIVTDYLGKTHTYAYVRENEKSKITLTGDTDDTYSEELFDELGRKIRTGVKDIQGNMSYKDYKYDIYNRNFSVSEPNTGNPKWSTTVYDVYGRPETVTDYKGKVLTMTYDKLTTTVIDVSTGQTKTSTKNAMGNVVTMAESPIGGTINYSYFANGNLKETNYNGNKITITQDGWGRKTSLTDPSAGTYTYDYNGLGESIKETTPNGTTTYTLNDWGKPETKTIAGTNTNSNTVYTYTPDSKLLLKTVYTDAGDAGKTIATDYTYDSKKRLETTTEKNGYGAVFFKKIEYDDWGRVNIETREAKLLNGKASTTVTQNEYKNGSLYKIYKIENGQITKTLWETKEVNARGQLRSASIGGRINITNTYDQFGYAYNFDYEKAGTLTGRPVHIMALTTEFNPQNGNLKNRRNDLFNRLDIGVLEEFKYDSQDRLTEYPNALGVQETQYYEDDGRIKSNMLGAYNYTNTSKKYQNTSITATPEALSYYETKPLQTVSYNTFKSPVEIVEDGKDKISFVYNDNNDRSVMFYGGLGLKETRTYRKHYSADGTMEIKGNTQTGAIEFVTYIGGDGYSAPVVYKKTYDSAGTTQEQTLYLLRDYQGSILAITNETGNVLEKRQFDAWGAIIKVQDGSGNVLSGLTILDRGYTGHEHLQSVGLIHMNGRLYDPKLHRFLQPDNFVQDASNTQNYNRYGYVLNNPLKYTDPSGEFKINWNDVVAGVAIVAGTVLCFVPGGAAVGVPLIGAGVAHFGAAYAEYTRTGDWNAASNNAGISFSATVDPGWGDSDSKKNHASGVTQSEPVVKTKTVDDGKGDDLNKYGVFNASMGIVSGIVEITVGVGGEGFTAGFSTALIVDGWYRVGSNSARLGMYLAHEDLVGDIIPSNSGALAGKFIDGMNGAKVTDVGRMQLSMGIANDFGLFVATGGNGQACYDAFTKPEFIYRAAAGTNFYTIYDYWHLGNEYKKNK